MWDAPEPPEEPQEAVAEAEGPIVRVMRRADMPALVEIDGLTTGSQRPEYWRARMEMALDSEHGLFISLVAEIQDRVVGFLMGQMHRGKFGLPETIASIDTIGVHPGFQGRGLGARLMEDFASLARKAGVQRIRTLVDWNRQWDLVNYFRNAGFSPAGSVMILERVL